MENPAQPETFSQLIACSPYVKDTGQLPTRLLEHIYECALTEPEKLKTVGALLVLNHCGVLPRSVKLSKAAADKVDGYMERMEKMRGTSVTQKKNHAKKVGVSSEENGSNPEKNPSASHPVPAETTFTTPDSLPTENQNQTETQTEKEPTNTNRPTREEVRAFGLGEGLALDPDSFFDSMEERGWKDRDGRPVKSWKGLYRSWSRTMGEPEPTPTKAGKQREADSTTTMELPDGTYIFNGKRMHINEEGVLVPMDELGAREPTWSGDDIPSFPWEDEGIPF